VMISKQESVIRRIMNAIAALSVLIGLPVHYPNVSPIVLLLGTVA